MSYVGYVFLGVLLFLLGIVFSQKYNFSSIQNFVFSMVYLLIVSGICSRLGLFDFNENIFMVVVVELFCQIFYVNYFLEKDFFNKKDKYFSFYVFKIIVAFLLNQELINKVSDVFLTGDDLKVIIWLLVIVYLYQFFKERELNISVSKNDRIITKESIALSFAKLKLVYGEDISNIDDSKKLVLYSIMIFNNYRRPKIFRRFDNILFKLDNKPRKLGIMQVMSKKYITDYESIILCTKKIEKLYEKNKKDIDVINLYDKDNSKDICHIYEEVKKFCKL